MSKRLLSGHEVEEISREELKAIGFDIFLHGMVRIKPGGWMYPGTSPKFLDNINSGKLELRPDDVMLIGFPKSGTTWLQETLWTMLHNIKLDNPMAKEPVWLRVPDISLDMMSDLKPMGGKALGTYREKFHQLCPGKDEDDGTVLQMAEALPSPRIMKSHFPLSLMPKNMLDNIKVVYVARNPKDMAVSLFHFFNGLTVVPYEGGKESLFKAILNNQTPFCPYWPHVKEAWEKRNHPNLLFLFYEDMKADIMKELGKINEFLGTNLSKEALETVAKHTSFSSMKSRGEPIKDEIMEGTDDKKATFYRKGTRGDWKNHFSPEMQKECDSWIEKHLASTDMSLSWALGQ